MFPEPYPDPVYFPRASFAKVLLDSLSSGMVNSQALFAPRRMGKTEFVKRDVLPAHAKRGGDAIYLSLWENKASPESVILGALLAHINARRAPSRKKSGKVEASVNLGIVNLKADVSEEHAAETPVETIGAAMLLWADILRKNKQIGLLVIDEVQHLASSEKFEGFAAALRTALEGSSDCIKLLATGSSQTGLLRMFNDNRAPFYGPGNQISLPPLGSDFVTFIHDKCREMYRQAFEVEDLQHVFDLYGGSPYFLRHAIQSAINRQLPLKHAATMVGLELAETSGLLDRWNALSARDHAILQLVYGRNQLYTAASLNMIGALTNEAVTPRNIQVAVAKLERGGWIEKSFDKGYVLADPAVHAFIMAIQRNSLRV